jgi:acyl dehydratase
LPLLSKDLTQWIGREYNYSAPEEIGRASIRYFALAIGDGNRLYFDDEYARAAGYPGVIAPPTFICETNQYAHRQPNADGYIGHSWDLPLLECRMIRGGHQYEFFQPVRPQDRIAVNWRLEDISEHNSSRGGSMLIVIARGTFSNQHGERLAQNRETLIFQPLQRGVTSTASVSSQSSRPEGRADNARSAESADQSAADFTQPNIGQQVPTLERTLDLVRMIAYAGATWDWARLHYDPAYVAERNLPAPIIDGQMLGALLSEMLLDWLGPHASIQKLDFRLRAMVFAGETVRCEGEVASLVNGGKLRLVKIAQRVRVGDRLVADGVAEVQLSRR